jgi:fructose-1,6-bisphosphatase I
MQIPTIPLYSSQIFPPKSRYILPKIHPLPPKAHLLPHSFFCRRRRMAHLGGFGFGVRSQVGGGASSGVDDGFCTFLEYVGKGGIDVGDDLVVLLDHIQYACKRIAALVASPLSSSLGKQASVAGSSGSGRDAPKPLDIVSVS